MKLSVVVPVYNEKDTVEQIIHDIMESPVKELEIIVVDDYSTDGTRDILKEKIEPLVEKVLYHEKNMGKGAALRTGFKEVSGDCVVVQDAD
ncbi:MAG: glycosyltransferase family 2 protein, partial [Firmicutes bacterium]|nr:glycosyltransferase family 2 protein [Bacillota bacterium]